MAQQEAQQAANDLAARLGPHYQPRIYNKFGWHCTAVTDDGRISVRYDPRPRKAVDTYSVVLRNNLATVYWGCGVTPEDAMAMAVAQCHKAIAEVQSYLDLVEANPIQPEVAV